MCCAVARREAGSRMNVGSRTARPALSIAICTYNRSAHLAGALTSLARQEDLDRSALEVLVIDNNSTDDTQSIVESFSKGLPVRRIFERQQGLSHARNRAIDEFAGDVLVFTDDDVRVAPTWLAAYWAAIARFPQAEFFGGRILPDWQGNKPGWVREPCIHLIDGALVWFDHGSKTRLFRSDEPTPFGASFGLRRSLIGRIGRFRTDLGTGGSGAGRGEETEFLVRACDAGATGAYVGQALSFHAVDPRRLTLPALYRHGRACGRSNAVMTSRPSGTIWSAGDFLLRGVVQMVKGRGDRFRQCVVNAGMQMGSRKVPGMPAGNDDARSITDPRQLRASTVTNSARVRWPDPKANLDDVR